jgi:hypothetical protein
MVPIWTELLVSTPVTADFGLMMPTTLVMNATTPVNVVLEETTTKVPNVMKDHTYIKVNVSTHVQMVSGLI